MNILLFLLLLAVIAEAGLGFRTLSLVRRRAVAWRHGRHGCPGPFVRIRSEVVNKFPYHCNSQFWIEAQLTDVRVRCPECGRVHQLHTSTLVRHELED